MKNNKAYSPAYFFRSSLILIFMAEIFVMLVLPRFSGASLLLSRPSLTRYF